MSDGRSKYPTMENDEEDEAAKAAAEVLAALSGGGAGVFRGFDAKTMSSRSHAGSRRSDGRDDYFAANGDGLGGKKDDLKRSSRDRLTNCSSSCESGTSTIAAATKGGSSSSNGTTSNSKRSRSRDHDDDRQGRNKKSENDVFKESISGNESGRPQAANDMTMRDAFGGTIRDLDGMAPPSDEKRKKKKKDKKKKRKIRDAGKEGHQARPIENEVSVSNSRKKANVVSSSTDRYISLKDNQDAPLSNVQDRVKPPDVPVVSIPSRIVSLPKRSSSSGRGEVQVDQLRREEDGTNARSPPSDRHGLNDKKETFSNVQVQADRVKSKHRSSEVVDLNGTNETFSNVQHQGDRVKSKHRSSEVADKGNLSKSYLRLNTNAPDQGRVKSSSPRGVNNDTAVAPVLSALPSRVTSAPKRNSSSTVEQQHQASANRNTIEQVRNAQSVNPFPNSMNRQQTHASMSKVSRQENATGPTQTLTLPTSAAAAASPDNGNNDMWGTLYQQLLQQIMSLPQQPQASQHQQQQQARELQQQVDLLSNLNVAVNSRNGNGAAGASPEDGALSMVQDVVNQLFQSFQAVPSTTENSQKKGTTHDQGMFQQASPQQLQNSLSLLEQQMQKLQEQEQLQKKQRAHQQQQQQQQQQLQQQLLLQQNQWNPRQVLNTQEQQKQQQLQKTQFGVSANHQVMDQDANLQQMLLQYQQIMKQQQQQAQQQQNRPSPSHHRPSVTNGFASGATKPDANYSMQRDALQQHQRVNGHAQQQQQQFPVQLNNLSSSQDAAVDPFTAALAALVQGNSPRPQQQPMHSVTGNNGSRMVLPQEQQQMAALFSQASQQANNAFSPQTMFQQQQQQQQQQRAPSQNDNAQDQANVLLNSLISLLQPTPTAV